MAHKATIFAFSLFLVLVVSNLPAEAGGRTRLFRFPVPDTSYANPRVTVDSVDRQADALAEEIYGIGVEYWGADYLPVSLVAAYLPPIEPQASEALDVAAAVDKLTAGRRITRSVYMLNVLADRLRNDIANARLGYFVYDSCGMVGWNLMKAGETLQQIHVELARVKAYGW